MRKKVALLFGGPSVEHEVSLTSAMSVLQNLDETLFDVSLIGVTHEKQFKLISHVDFLQFSKNPRDFKMGDYGAAFVLSDFSPQNLDVVFNMIHGSLGEDGSLAGFLEMQGVAYVGSRVLGHAVCMDKDVAKRLLMQAGIPVVPYLKVFQHEFVSTPEGVLNKASEAFGGFPYFVKPANAGSSVGVHKVKNLGQALSAFEDAFQFDSKVLIEKAIDAREIECSVLGNYQPKASLLGEVIPHHEFYSYEAKYLDAQGAGLQIPAELSPEVNEKVRKMAVDAFIALECFGLTRVDFFLERKTHAIYVNELNTIPGFTGISMYPKLWEAAGLPMRELLSRLIALALELEASKKLRQTHYR